MVKGKLEIVRLSLLQKIETDGAALISYGRQFHIAGAAQRKARDPIFVRDEHGSSFLSSKNLARDAGSQVRWFTGLKKFVRQSGDVIVCAPLDRKPIKLLQSLRDTDAHFHAACRLL